MKKLLIGLVVVALILTACSKNREVHQVKEVTVADPSFPRMDNDTDFPPQPAPTPTPEPTPVPQPEPTPMPQPEPTPMPMPTPEPQMTPTPEPMPMPGGEVETMQPEQPNWLGRKEQATGYGAIDLSRGHSMAQAQLMARRAAISDARRNLLERILGLQISSTTTVRNFVAETDKIDSSSNGVLRGARTVYTQPEGGDQIKAVVEIDLNSVYDYVKSRGLHK